MFFGTLARGLPRIAIATGALALAACATTPPPAVGTVDAAPVEAAGQAGFAAADSAEYRLRPSDTISVAVYREPELSLAAVPVGSDGTVAVPLAGAIRAEGRTSVELANDIAAALRRGFVNDPKVAVNVIRYDSHRVTVEGAVKKPGVFQFVPGSRLSSAIAMAEGPERVAKLDQVAVFRAGEEGMTVAKFDYRAMQQGTMIDPVLRPGDRVVVGTSGLSQFWQDVLKTIPAFALFTNI
jgi:polysaccharide export outer membrane protein